MFLMSIEKLVQYAVTHNSSDRTTAIIFSIIFAAVGIGWFLYASLVQKVPWWLKLGLGSPQKHKTIMKVGSIGMVCFAVLVVVLTFAGPTPDEVAEITRSYLEGMQRGVTRIALSGGGEVGKRYATIKDQPALEHFSAAIAQSKPIRSMDSGDYYDGHATIHTQDGIIIELYYRYHSVSTKGVQFNLSHKVDSTGYDILEFRNDDIGRLFAEALEFVLIK